MPDTPKTKKIDIDVELESDIHYTIDELIQAKSCALYDNSNRIERRKIVHAFTNMQDTTTEQERDDQDIEEIINFGTTFRSAQTNIAPLESIVTGTDSLCDLVVDFNDPNHDHLLGVEISNVANEWLFNSNEKFQRFWRTVTGEGYLVGGGPAVFDDEEVGLFPRYNRNIFFPLHTSLDPDEMTFAFERREFTMSQLKELIKHTDDDDSMVSKASLEAIIEEIRDQVEGGASVNHETTNHGYDLETNSSREQEYNNITFEIWGYWEVRTYPDDYKDKSKRGLKYVSHILFSDTYINSESSRDNGTDSKSQKGSDIRTILYQDKIAFSDPREWLVMMVFDEEIGGEKTIDTLRGVAEAFYKPAVKIEEFFNKKMDGALASSVPYLVANDSANPDEVLDFEFGDAFLPKGTEFAQIPNTARELNPVISDLTRTVAGISGGGQSNTGRGQELRQQAVERQENSSIIKTNRIINAYLRLDNILDIVIGRAMNLEAKPGTTDYRLIMGFQSCVDQKIIEILNLRDDEQGEGEIVDDVIDDEKSTTKTTALAKAKQIRKKIAMREFGKFKYFKVKARRSASGLDRPSEIENASFILRLIETGRVAAQNVPALIQRAVAYQTQNTDIAQLAAQTPDLIQSDQAERAAAEWSTIGRRAVAGEIVEIGARDIDADHVESHKMDLIADVNLHGLRPWDQADVVMFVARVNHTGSHLERMRQRQESAGVARDSIQEFQEIIRGAGQIIQLLEEQRAQEQNNGEDLSPADRLSVAREQKIYAEIEILGRNYGLNLEDTKDTMRQRLVRAQQGQQRLDLLNRSQIVREIENQRDFDLKRIENNV